MPVELIKDLLKIDQTIGKDEIQALVEGEILLEDNKPNIDKVLTVDGDVKVKETRMMKDKVIVSGIVNFKVLYTAEEEKQPIHSLNALTDFEEEIELQGAEEGMIADIKAYIEHIDYRLLEGTKISVKAVVDIEGKVSVGNSIDIVKNISGAESLQILKESIKYDDVIGTNTSTTIVKEAFEIDEDLPDIVDILRVDVNAYERETTVVEGRVIVAGLVECSIMYFGDDEENRINYLRREIPFTHFVELSNAQKDAMSDVRLETSDVSYEAKEDINGNMRIIDVEAMVEIGAKVYEQRQKEVTVDTYSTNKKLNVKKQEVNITENIGHNVSKEIVKGIVNVSEEDENINSVYNVNVKPILTDYRIVEEKVIIEGFLGVDMLYQGEESGEIKNIKQEVPFKSYVDIEGVDEGMESEIKIALDDVRFNKVNQQEVEVEATVKANISVNRIKKINIVTEVEELSDEIDKTDRPSITIYIVQKDDTLWDIAKRYNTTVEELIQTNDIINPENIMPGEKIIIQKNIEIDL